MGSTSSRTIALAILKCLFVFYSAYYVTGSVCFACYRLKYFDGKIPFDFLNWIDLAQCCGNYTDVEIVNAVSMEVTFVACGLLFGVVLTQSLWDYAITITLIHILLSCLVMLAFPLSWSWWLCLGLGLIQTIALGEAVTYAKRKRKQFKVSPVIEPKSPLNYLYKKV